MADFLLELLSEEIPARMQARARNDLARMFAEEMAGARLPIGTIETYSTPRRLVLIARDVAEATEAIREETKGPRVSAPPQAIEGFLAKTGLTRDQLEERDGVLFAVVDRPGRTAAEVLEVRIPLIVWKFPWPKSMRWGPESTRTDSLRWVRPLHNVVALLGDEDLRISLDMIHVYKQRETGETKLVGAPTGITSGATTVGHRFHHPGAITIGGAHDYLEKLRACHVIVDQDERERLIREGAAAAAKEAGLTLLEDEGLVAENAGLTGWPVPVIGRFDPEFLDVPREVIVLTMRTNQKYFACLDDEALLAPAFVCIANVAAKDGGEAIVEGNRRVLAARLADARFFWEQDLKIPLAEQAKKLDGIIFHEKLGTVADKVERVARLARWLVEEGIVKADAKQVERAARLAKADLVTGMVGEFPELQGVIGGYLAAAQGEPKPVAAAIRDHYGTPSDPTSVAVALADKLDTISAFFSIGLKPTGSKDPFALRRAAIASIELIVGNGLRLGLTQALRGSLANRAGQAKEADAAHRLDKTAVELLDFFADRLKVQQRDAGVRHDLIDAVFALGGEDDLVRLLARVTALQEFVQTEDGSDLLTAYKRAANILKREKWEGGKVAGSPEIPPEEQALIDVLDNAEPKASAAVEKENFTAAMAALASLRAPIDAFFDHVTVNDPHKDKRARRLNLLMRFRDAVNGVANFSRIEA